MTKYTATRSHVFDRWVFVEGDEAEYADADVTYINRNVPGLLVLAEGGLTKVSARQLKAARNRQHGAAEDDR